MLQFVSVHYSIFLAEAIMFHHIYKIPTLTRIYLGVIVLGLVVAGILTAHNTIVQTHLKGISKSLKNVQMVSPQEGKDFSKNSFVVQYGGLRDELVDLKVDLLPGQVPGYRSLDYDDLQYYGVMTSDEKE